MPLYDYKCHECGEIQELILPMNESKQELFDRPCQKCQSNHLIKQVAGVPSIAFIGSGFYVNDYKKISKGKDK